MQLLTTGEAAQRARVSPAHMRALVAGGEISSAGKNARGGYLIPDSGVDDWLGRRRQERAPYYRGEAVLVRFPAGSATLGPEDIGVYLGRSRGGSFQVMLTPGTILALPPDHIGKLELPGGASVQAALGRLQEKAEQGEPR